MIPRIKETYKNEIVASMMKDFKYKSVMQVPKLEKIVLNIGVGEAVKEIKVLDFDEDFTLSLDFPYNDYWDNHPNKAVEGE